MPAAKPRRHGWETWTWDESLFEGAAPHYVRGRLPYAPGLAAALAEAVELDATARLLDVGCGPGVIALDLAHRFAEVVGLDPDAGMLREAERLASERGVHNATWVKMRAEELPAGLGQFRVITFGASFHWMDRPRVAAIVRQMLDASGAVVQVDSPARGNPPDTEDGLPFPAPPNAAIAGLRAIYLGRGTRAGQGIRNSSPDGEDAVFQAAGFRPGVRVSVPDGRVIERTADDMVAYVFSLSSSAPHLFGTRIADFERELREILLKASPYGRFAVRLPPTYLTFWRL
jgi:SAM-dependent methyltransferase